MRCEVCGKKALRLVDQVAPARHRGSTAMSLLFVARIQCPFAQPRSQVVVSLDGLLRYTHRHEIAVEEPGHAAEPFAEQSSESHTAAVGEAWRPAGCRAKGLRGIESL